MKEMNKMSKKRNVVENVKLLNLVYFILNDDLKIIL